MIELCRRGAVIGRHHYREALLSAACGGLIVEDAQPFVRNAPDLTAADVPAGAGLNGHDRYLDLVHEEREKRRRRDGLRLRRAEHHIRRRPHQRAGGDIDSIGGRIGESLLSGRLHPIDS